MGRAFDAVRYVATKAINTVCVMEWMDGWMNGMHL